MAQAPRRAARPRRPRLTVVPTDRQLGDRDALEENQQLTGLHRVIVQRRRLL